MTHQPTEGRNEIPDKSNSVQLKPIDGDDGEMRNINPKEGNLIALINYNE
jgi:hypothetical protein